MICSIFRWTRQPSGRNVQSAGADLADEAAAHEQLVADAASASAGASRRVGRKSCEARAIIVVRTQATRAGSADASAIASAAGFAIFRRFGRCMPSAIHLSISWKSSSIRMSDDDLLQHAAVRVDEADVAAAGDAEVGVARLARAVDRAAEHRDLEVLRVRAQPLLDLLGERLDADVVAAAASGRRSSPARARAGRAPSGSRTPSSTSSTGSAVSETRIVSPIPSTSSAPMPTALLIEPENGVPGLGDAEVERVRHLLGEHPVGADHRRHVARLDRDLEVVEVEPLEQPHLLERRLDERLGLVLLRELVEVLRQRAGVGADPHRDPGLLRGLDDELDLVGAADVAGVDADGGDALPRSPSARGSR